MHAPLLRCPQMQIKKKQKYKFYMHFWLLKTNILLNLCRKATYTLERKAWLSVYKDFKYFQQDLCGSSLKKKILLYFFFFLIVLQISAEICLLLIFCFDAQSFNQRVFFLLKVLLGNIYFFSAEKNCKIFKFILKNWSIFENFY